MVDHAHIPGVHDVGALLVFVDVKVLPGPLLLHQGELIAAGLGAGTPVGIPAGHVVGQQAPAGVGHAHGAVGEGLDLQALGGLGPDLGDLPQVQFPGQDDPVSTQLVPGGGRLVVDNAGLGGDVDLHVGGVLLGQTQHTHIRQDDGGDPRLLQQLQPLRQTGHLIVAGHGVAGHVGIHSVGLAEGNGLFHLLGGKIPGEGAHTEGGTRQVDGVSPVGHCHLQAFPVPGRGQ